MNVFTHPGRFSDDARRARRFWLAGLASIFISLTLSMVSGLHPVLIFLAYPFLLIGLPLWTMGRAGQRRLKTMPRPDLLLNAELKALNDKYSLHHYAPYGGGAFDHLLVTPAGLIVIVTSDVPGPVTCNPVKGSDRWSSPSSFLDRITGVKPSIGNPSVRATAQVDLASSFLKAETAADVPVKGLIVFTQNPDLELGGCTHAAVPLEEVRLAVKLLQDEMTGESSQEEARGRILTSDQRRRLNSALSPQIAPVIPRAVPAKR
ncbi:MAG: nuclease-related domain-containing protein [Chloroflexia bacterium]